MIYIFKGVQSICSLPGMACNACGELCKQINCSVCANCCSSIGEGVKAFFTKPLSTFVIICFVMSGVQIYLCYTAILSACKFPESAFLGFNPFLFIQIGFSIINIIFAFFFQCQVWKKIMHLVAEDPEHKAKITDVLPSGPGMAGQAKKGLKGGFMKLSGHQDDAAPDPVMPEAVTKVRIHKDTVQAAFRSTFLEDFGVLAYFFALIGVFVVSWMASTWMNSGDVCDKAKATATVGMAFFIVAFLYTFTYYCCSCCAATVEMDKDDVEGDP